MRVYTGTSGYSYKEWRGSFYPDKLPADAMLRHYAEQLPAVEINNTFYRMPKSALMARWAEQVPDAFRFVIKGSRRITHQAKLADPGQALGFLWGSIEKLGQNLGPVFFQLPKYLRKDPQLLREFLAATEDRFRCAFEFQHRTWWDDEVFEVLGERGAAAVFVDSGGADADDSVPLPQTADWGYLRLRGENYTDADLARFAERIRATSWREAFVFFKHEEGAAGPALARRMQDLFDGQRSTREESGEE